jgi:hypothetical protein
LTVASLIESRRWTSIGIVDSKAQACTDVISLCYNSLTGRDSCSKRVFARRIAPTCGSAFFEAKLDSKVWKQATKAKQSNLRKASTRLSEA